MFSPGLGPICGRIEPLEQFTRDTRLLVLDEACWSADQLAMLWPEMDAAFMPSGAGGLPAAARRPVVMIAVGEGRTERTT